MEDPTRMTREEALAFIAGNHWTFAKSMPQVPHYWCSVKTATDAADLTRFLYFIHENGQRMRWGRSPPRSYLDVDGWRYWFMSDHPSKSILANRELIEGSKCIPC
jgi:hypothetical protein